MVIGGVPYRGVPLLSLDDYRIPPRSASGVTAPTAVPSNGIFNNGHRRNESAGALDVRSRQESRPRNLLPSDRVPSLPRIQTTPNVEPRAFGRAASVGGRGGIGFRLRALASPAGATSEQSKTSFFPWKGKAKAKEISNASTYGAPTLTRTDTVDSTTSSIQFVAPRPPPLSISDEDPLSVMVLPLHPSPDSRNQGAMHLQKLSRTLGVEVGSQISPLPPRSRKAVRRSSLSVFAAYSDVALADGSLAEKFLRRRSSYEPIAIQRLDVDDLPGSQPHTPQYDALTPTNDHRSTADTLHPSPPSSPQSRYTVHRTYEEGNLHEMFTSDDASTTENLDLSPILFRSPSPMRFHTCDPDDEENWDPSPTPARESCTSSSRPETPLPVEKHFLTAATARLVASLAWDSEDSLVSKAPDEGWSGEWNRGDIRDVISSLRELKR